MAALAARARDGGLRRSVAAALAADRADVQRDPDAFPAAAGGLDHGDLRELRLHGAGQHRFDAGAAAIGGGGGGRSGADHRPGASVRRPGPGAERADAPGTGVSAAVARQRFAARLRSVIAPAKRAIVIDRTRCAWVTPG